MAIDTHLDNIQYLRNNTLTPEERRMYDAFASAITRRSSRPGYYSHEGLDNDTINKVIQAVVLDNPQFVEINFFKRRGDAAQVNIDDLNFFKVDTPSRQDTKRIENIVNKMVQETKKMNDLDKAMHIFKYLAKMVTYDLKAYDKVAKGQNINDYLSSFSMIGALINKKAVCQGISLAYEYLLIKCGFKNTYIQPCFVGEVGHCFNVLIINDENGEHYINVDLTFSMRRPTASYITYNGREFFVQNMWGFGISSKVLESLNYRMMYQSNPADDSYSYLRRNNLIFNDFPSLRQYIKRQANKHGALTFSYQGTYSDREMQNMLIKLAELQGFKAETQLLSIPPFYCYCGGDYYD